jgi:hypothetical protein
MVLNIGSLLRAQPIKPGRGQGSLWPTQWSDTGHEGGSRKGVASVALIAAMNLDDIAIVDPRNL